MKTINKVRAYGIKTYARRGIRKFSAIVCFWKRGSETISIADLFRTSPPSEYTCILVALRYLAIENFYGKNSFGFDLYRKVGMQNGSLNPDASIEQFVDLIKSFDENGYNQNSILFIDKGGNIYNGNHRMALCLYHNINNITVKPGRTALKMPRANDVYREWRLSDEEIELLKETSSRLLGGVSKSLKE